MANITLDRLRALNKQNLYQQLDTMALQIVPASPQQIKQLQGTLQMYDPQGLGHWQLLQAIRCCKKWHPLFPLNKKNVQREKKQTQDLRPKKTLPTINFRVKSFPSCLRFWGKSKQENRQQAHSKQAQTYKIQPSPFNSLNQKVNQGKKLHLLQQEYYPLIIDSQEEKKDKFQERKAYKSKVF